MRDHDRDRKRHSHFNRHEFDKIYALYRKDPYTSLECYERYFELYPDDNSGKTYYISNLIAVGQFDKAMEEIAKLEVELDRNRLYQRSAEKETMFVHNIKLCKLKLYIFSDQKDKAAKLYCSCPKEFEYLGREVVFYLKQISGLNKPMVRDHHHYMVRQIYDYQEQDFRDHIQKHLPDFNDNDSSISSSIFVPDFPIDKVIEEIKKYIPSKKRVSYGFVDDTYVFKFDQCGRDNNRLVDYIKVVTFNNSSNIITMFPAEECEMYDYEDLNYLNKQEDQKVLAKMPSQIDKFYKRYSSK